MPPLALIAAAHARAWGLPVAPKRKAYQVALGFLGFSLVIALVHRLVSLMHDGLLLPPASSTAS